MGQEIPPKTFNLLVMGDNTQKLLEPALLIQKQEVFHVDTFDEIKTSLERPHNFDVIVLLPSPKHSKNIAELEQRQREYNLPHIILTTDETDAQQFIKSDIFAALVVDELTPNSWLQWLRQAALMKKHQTQLLELERTRIELQESNHLVDNIFKMLPDSINVFDVKNSRQLYGNRRIAETLGYSKEEIDDMGDNLTAKLLHPDDAVALSAYQQEVLSSKDGKTTTAQIRMKDNDGHWVWIESHHSVFRRDDEGNVSEILGVARNIDIQKQIEKQLMDALLYEEYLSDAKNHFIRVTSHEFRTPLAIIQSACETVRRYSDRMTEEERNQRFDKILDQIRHVTKMVDDSLSIVNLDDSQSQFPLILVNVKKHCQTLIEDFEAAHNISGRIQLATEGCEDKKLYIRETLYWYILHNLLSNAHKYTPDVNAKIYVSLKCCDDKIILVVKDTGIGIPEENLSHVTNTFYRGKNVEDFQGTGLGLYIVARAVERYNGKYHITSNEGQGTTVTVELPVITSYQ